MDSVRTRSPLGNTVRRMLRAGDGVPAGVASGVRIAVTASPSALLFHRIGCSRGGPGMGVKLEEMTTDVEMAGNRRAEAAKALFGITPEELRDVVEGLGLPKFRAVQLANALYKQRVTGLDEVTTLPLDLRERLIADGCRGGL